jgi:hypothetical protein
MILLKASCYCGTVLFSYKKIPPAPADYKTGVALPGLAGK